MNHFYIEYCKGKVMKLFTRYPDKNLFISFGKI